jgi:hypothetical protein
LDEFGGCGRGITVVILFGPLEEGLFKIEALAECGVVEVEDGYEFVAEAFLWCVASYAEFEMCTGLVKVTD